MKKRRLVAGIMGGYDCRRIAGCAGGVAKPADKDGNVTIKVALWDYSNTAYYKTIIEAFEKAYPNIKVEPVEFAADEYQNVIVTQLGGKQDFDVVFTKGSPDLSALINQSHIAPLDDLMKNDASFKAENYAGLVEALAIDGKSYALPFRYDNWLVYYNKDLFDAAGVAYPEDGMSMAEYHELATKMTSGEANEKVYGAHAHTWPSGAYIFGARTEEFNFMNPDTYTNLVPYYTELLAMQDEGIIQDYGALKSSNIHYSGVFYNQQVAMSVMGTWFINMLCENVKDFNWGVCSMPNNAGMGNENSVGGITPVSIGAYAKHPEEAWKFITFACGEEGAKVLANCGIVPGFSSPAIGEIFDALPKTHTTAPEGLSKYISCSKALPEQPMSTKSKEIDTVINEQHSAIMTKSVTPEEGINEMVERAKEVLAK